MPISQLQVRLFGFFSLSIDGQTVPLPAAANARRLLAYLCVHRTAHARVALAGKLWPEVSENKARQDLRQALWNINRSLPALLQVDAEQVCLNPDISLQPDCVEFECLVQLHLQGKASWPEAARDLERAVALYQGDLLEGYYDDWVILERERLYELYLQALEKLIVAFKATLRYEQALAVALQLATVNPLSENAHREAMRLHHYLGNPAAALKQYQRCEQSLKQELGILPAPETLRLMQAISQQARGTHANHEVPFLPMPRPVHGGDFLHSRAANAIPLVGRRSERDTLVRWMRLEAGQGTLILLEGEAGVGKTRLLQEAGRDAAWHGAQVLWGKAAAAESGRALEQIVEAVESALTPLRVEQLQHLIEPLWLLVLQPLLPDLTEGLNSIKTGTDLTTLPALQAEHARNRLFEAFGSLFAAWSTITPLVIILEDIHWSDADTLEALARLPHYLAASPVAIVASYRNEEMRLARLLADIRPHSIRGRLRLTGLCANETSALMQSVLGGEVTHCFAEALFKETRGNPLFTLEFLRGLAGSGVLRQNPDGSWLSPYDCDEADFDLPLPQTIEDVISHRLGQLPASLSESLQALAVLGNQFDFKQAACLSLTHSAGSLIATLQELVERRLLAETAQGYHFQHDKIRQSVYENIPPAHRLALHTQIGLALEVNYPGQVALLAHHFAAGGEWKKAYHYHRLVAIQAQASFAYASAGQHIERALEAAAQCGVSWQEEFDLRRRYNEILGVLGKRPEQEANLARLTALAEADTQHLCEARLQQASFLYAVSRFGEAEAIARQAISLARHLCQAGSQVATSMLAEALITLADILGWAYVGQYAAIDEILDEAAELCRRTGDLVLQARLHQSAAFGNYPLHPNPDRIAEAQQALGLYQELADKAHTAEMACTLAAFLQDAGGDYEQIIDYERMALEIARSIGYRILEGRVLNNWGNLDATRNVNQALQNFDRAADIFASIQDERRAAISRLNAANYHLLLLGDRPVAQAAIESALDYAQRSGDRWTEGYALLLSGVSAWQQGDLCRARQLLGEALATFEITKTTWLHTRTYMLLAQAEQESGEMEQALARLEAAEAIARPSAYHHQLAFIESIRASIKLQQGELERAARHSTEAMKAWSAGMEYAWEIPFTHYQVLQTCCQPEPAGRALQQAYDALEKMLDPLTPEQRTLSCQNIQQHARILSAWQAGQPQTLHVRLPRLNHQSDDETVDVCWTLAAPEDAQFTGKVGVRRWRLARLLRQAAEQGGKPTHQQLAEALGVSLRTVTQDLAALRIKE